MKNYRIFNEHCEKCKKSLCPEHAYSYVDGNNIAITNNAPTLCKECYEKTYNEKILSEVDSFKNKLITNLQNIRIGQNVQTIKIDNLIKYIENL